VPIPAEAKPHLRNFWEMRRGVPAMAMPPHIFWKGHFCFKQPPALDESVRGAFLFLGSLSLEQKAISDLRSTAVLPIINHSVNRQKNGEKS
jgi:hypothetical protein